MIFHGNQSFFAKSKITPANEDSAVTDEPLFCWQVKLFPMERRTAAAFMNEANGFCVVLYGLRAEHFRRLDKVFLTALGQVATRARITRQGLEEYLQMAGKPIFLPMVNRSMMGRAHYMSRELASMERYWNWDSTVQVDLSHARNSSGTWGRSQHTPLEMMAADLQALVDGTVIGGSAVQIRADLVSDRFTIWRRLILPLPVTFAALGQTVLTAFGWDGNHLSEFELAERGKKSIRITGPQSHFIRSYDPDIADGDRRLVDEYLRDYRTFWLTYNFQEQWRYRIRIETTVDEYAGLTGLCLEGEGPQLPEGFGGPKTLATYDHLLENEQTDHPEYARALEVLHPGNLKAFDAVEVNTELGRL